MKSETILFRMEKDRSGEIKETLSQVYSALQEKGYDPIIQLVGYILSGEPTYITNHKNARNIISRIERDEILEEIIKSYLKSSD